MSGNVVTLGGGLSPAEILDHAFSRLPEMKSLIIAWEDKDGENFFSASDQSKGDVSFKILRIQVSLLSGEI